jgi:DNA damage-inducible protein 1
MQNFQKSDIKMKIGIAITQTLIIYIEADELGTIEDIKVLIEVETGIIASQQNLLLSNTPLNDNTAILDSGILENEILQLQAPISPVKLEALDLIQRVKEDPRELMMFGQLNPKLIEMLKSGDLIGVENFITSLAEEKRKAKLQEIDSQMKLDLDPLNPAAQKEIESRIQQKNIDENFKYAQEYVPEMFAKVTMLYIDIKVSGKPIQAFVDSGAQSTILSKKCADRLGILRLADTRFAGQVVGVGTDKIFGRIHAINLEIGGNFFDCSIYVIENAKIDMLFGLDMLKRHQCCIDLHKNLLTLNAGQISVPFLSDGQIHQKDDDEKMEIDKAKELSLKIPESKTSQIENEKNSVKNKEKIEENKAEEKKNEEKKNEVKKGNIVNTQTLPKPATSHPWEEKIKKIIGFGFSRDEAIKALNNFGGNEEMALSFLFSSGSPFGF